jgi:hypothetical protein
MLGYENVITAAHIGLPVPENLYTTDSSLNAWL